MGIFHLSFSYRFQLIYSIFYLNFLYYIFYLVCHLFIRVFLFIFILISFKNFVRKVINKFLFLSRHLVLYVVAIFAHPLTIFFFFWERSCYFCAPLYMGSLLLYKPFLLRFMNMNNVYMKNNDEYER